MNMKTKLLTLLLLLVSVFAFGQGTDATIDRGSGIMYFSGVPAYPTDTSAYSEIAYNKLTGEMWYYNRDSLDWKKLIAITQSYADPSGDPTPGPFLHINRSDGGLFQWTGAAWQEVVASTDDQTAAEVPITDAGGYYTGTEAETALQENGAKLTDADKGDITVGSSFTDFQINADAVGSNELASSGVTAGTYTNHTVTIDADGRITSASPRTVYFFGGGQSNMNETSSAGAGGDTTQNAQILLATTGGSTATWVAAYNSPLFQIAKNYIEDNPLDTVVCVLVAQNGTSINQWYQDSTLRDEAETTLTALGNPTLDGFFWLQGEFDRYMNAGGVNELLTGGAADSNYYDIWTDSVYNWMVSTAWASDRTPFIVGTTYDEADADYSGITINNALFRIGRDEETMTSVADLSGLPAVDGVHWGGATLDTVGIRFYNAWLSTPYYRQGVSYQTGGGGTGTVEGTGTPGTLPYFIEVDSLADSPLTTDGTDITNSGRYIMSDGTANNPAAEFLNYQGTGIYLGITDNFILASDSVDVITIEATTRDVGIKEDNPRVDLHVTGVTGANPSIALEKDSGEYWEVSQRAATSFFMYSDGVNMSLSQADPGRTIGGATSSTTSYLFIEDGTGNTGFDDTSPSAKVDINGDLRVQDGLIELNAVGTQKHASGAGSPESVLSANIGSIYRDTTNGEFYIKETGTGSTGWVSGGGYSFRVQANSSGTNFVDNSETLNFNSGRGITASEAGQTVTHNLAVSHSTTLNNGVDVSPAASTFQDNAYVSYKVVMTSGTPTSNSRLTLPDPTSVMRHSTVTVYVEDADSTYNGEVYNASGLIWNNGSQTTTVTLDDGEVAIFRVAGPNSGSTYEWVRVQKEPETYSGWAEYIDTSYRSTPLSITGGDTITLPNLAHLIDHDQLPIDLDSMYNRTDTTIIGRNGDGLNIAFEFDIAAATANTTRFEVWIDIGGGVRPLYGRTTSLAKGNGIVQPFSFSYGGVTKGTWESNGGKIKITANENVEISGDIVLLLTRTHKAR